MSLAVFAMSVRNQAIDQKPVGDGGFVVPWQFQNRMSAQAAGCKTRRNGVLHRHRFRKPGALMKMIDEAADEILRLEITEGT